MKKEYVTPSAYIELFTPNQYAGNCQPGISEDGLKKQTQSCFFYGKGNNNSVSGFTSGWNCSSKTATRAHCSNVDATKSVITSAASCDIKFDKSGSGLTVAYASLNGGERQSVYVWSNQNNGYHWMPTSSLPDNPTDSEGRPYYFNS